MTDLLSRVLEGVRDRGLFDPPGTTLLAVSGGADSLALLDLFAADGGLVEALELDVVVGHVDHGIHRESAAVSERVRKTAERYGVPCLLRTLELGADASETEARERRYAALRQMQVETGAAFLVTAHHADDQVETILYRALRGSAPVGLAGIPVRGPDGLVRPLLGVSHAELEAWAVARVGWSHEDPANRDVRHDRSWIRHELLPLLRDRFPDVEDRLVGLGQRAALERLAWAEALSVIPDLDFTTEGEGISFAAAAIGHLPRALGSSVLRAGARQCGVMVGPRRSEQLRRFLVAGASGRAFDLGGGWEARRVFDRCVIARREELETPESVTVSTKGSETIRWGRWEFTVIEDTAGQPARAGLETWIEVSEAELRGFEAGDRMRPLGGVGRRKVRRLLMEARVPFHERRSYPIIVQGRHVVWIPGICRSAHAVPRPGEPALRLEARVVGE